MSDELGARCSPTIWSMTDGAQGAESKELDRGEGSVLAELSNFGSWSWHLGLVYSLKELLHDSEYCPDDITKLNSEKLFRT